MIRKVIALVLICIGMLAMKSLAQGKWRMKPIAICTRWAKDVSPANVLPEYPRPQMLRTKWSNLNGLWKYALTAKDEDKPETFNGDILVPFPLESALSGVKKVLQPNELLWYKRTIAKPVLKTGKRVLLHFGAVDFDATVFINGKEIGNHKGGYQNFSFDVTDALTQPENELLVKVWDPSDKGPNPHGKQVLEPGGIMYTPSSGIWQTVWMEVVPTNYIESLRITPDIDKSSVNITINAATNADVNIEVNGKKIIGKSNEVISVPIHNAKFWSPDNPYLYDLKVTLGKDVVKSYFGMRKVEIKKDDKGIERIFLNNKYTYNLGTLDQGFWPDGLYTAPTDAALKFDIKAAKAMGFNTIRKHIKIEPARWYYHCDKLGMLVWQDMVNPGSDTEEGRKQFEKETAENIAHLYNYPSIISWVLFNENWGAYDQARLTKWVKDADSSRIVNGHSGSLIVDYNSPENTADGLSEKSTNSDVTDIHSYPPPGMPAHMLGKAMVLGEFGGIGVSVQSHLWNDIASGWGYGGTVSPVTMRETYKVMSDSLQVFEKRGLSGSIYTQPFDVESEQNGLITYDREVVKAPIAEIRNMNSIVWPITSNWKDVTKQVTVQVADTSVEDFISRLNAYKAGRRDSASLRALALMAAARRDSATKGGRTIADDYINQIVDPFTETNLLFIRHFTRTTKDAGFPILYNNLQKVNSILGQDAVGLRLLTAVEAEEITPFIKAGKADWELIKRNVTSKYPKISEEAILQAQVMYAGRFNDWDLFSKIGDKWFNDYGSQRKWISDVVLNQIAWAAFENTANTNALNTALKMSEKSIHRNPSPQYFDTYANLLYKLGQKEKAIEWEQKAVALNPNESAFSEALEKMREGTPTWPQQQSSSMK